MDGEAGMDHMDDFESMDDFMRRQFREVARAVEEEKARERREQLYDQRRAAEEPARAEALRVQQDKEEAERRARDERAYFEMSRVIDKFLAIMSRNGNPGSDRFGSVWRAKRGWLVAKFQEWDDNWDDGPRYESYGVSRWLLSDGSIRVVREPPDQPNGFYPRGGYGRATVSLERLLELLAENGLTWDS